MKAQARELALELLGRHPGWSDRRVSRELAKRGLRASHVSVGSWRREAGYAPARKSVVVARRRERIE